MRLLLALFFMGVSSAGVYRASTFRPLFNFHVVDPGRFYRSAQPRPDELRELVHQFGLKTVINLRGAQEDEVWFQDEAATLAELGVRFESLPFSSEGLQSDREWNDYLELLRQAARPILVHCRAGADRTGEASAVYKLEYMAADAEQALAQLTFTYLHVEWFKPNKRAFVKAYIQQRQTHSLKVPRA